MLSIFPTQATNITTANLPMLLVLDAVPDAVPDEVTNALPDGVSDELLDGKTHCDFSL
jgi:hypothetical protein